MPIQFQCPHCGHAMQLPDTAAGKQGKCPKCANAVTVPAIQAAPASPHDEEFWSELNAKKEVAQEDHDGHGPAHEKKSDAQLLKKMLGKAEAAKVVKRIGMSWERPREGRMFDRFWDTAIGVMNNATETFNEMKLTGGVGSPMRFMLIGVILGSLILAVYSTVGASISIIGDGGATAPAADEDEEAAPAGLVVTPAMVIAIVLSFFIVFFAMSIGGVIHIFLQAAGLQLALPMVGVKDASFEKSFRVTAFTTGSIFLCNIVPGLGGVFMLFLWFNGMIKGLESVYEIPNGTAVMAVLIIFVPLLLPFVVISIFMSMRALGYI